MPLREQHDHCSLCDAKYLAMGQGDGVSRPCGVL